MRRNVVSKMLSTFEEGYHLVAMERVPSCCSARVVHVYHHGTTRVWLTCITCISARVVHPAPVHFVWAISAAASCARCFRSEIPPKRHVTHAHTRTSSWRVWWWCQGYPKIDFFLQFFSPPKQGVGSVLPPKRQATHARTRTS